MDSTTRRQAPKSEFRRPKPERRPNTEGRSHAGAFRVSGFGLLSALGFRVSGLDLCAHGLVVLSRYARRVVSMIWTRRREWVEKSPSLPLPPAHPSRASPELHRSLPVVPLIPDMRYYGEAPGGLAGG